MSANARFRALEHLVLTMFLHGVLKNQDPAAFLRQFRAKWLSQAGDDADYAATINAMCDQLDGEIAIHKRRQN